MGGGGGGSEYWVGSQRSNNMSLNIDIMWYISVIDVYIYAIRGSLEYSINI